MRFSVVSWRSPSTVPVDRLATALADAGISKQVVGMGARTAFRRALAAAARELGHTKYDIKTLGKGDLGWRYQLSEAYEYGGRLDYRAICVATVVGTKLVFEEGEQWVRDIVTQAFQCELENQTGSFVDDIVHALFDENNIRVVPFCRAFLVQTHPQVLEKLAKFFASIHAPFRVLNLDPSVENTRSVAAVIEEHIGDRLRELKDLFKDGELSGKKLDRVSDLIAYLQCFSSVLAERATEISTEIHALLDEVASIKAGE